MRQFPVEECAQANQEHHDCQRQYAHVFHKDGVICVAHAFWTLPERLRLAILLHEAGHILAGPRGGEVAANRAAERYSGVPIAYRDCRFGTELEWIDPKHVNQAKIALGLNGQSLRAAEDLTDRAKRYRAQNLVQGPKRCVLCGATDRLDVMHLDGNESHGEPENLAYGCRSCNVRLANAFRHIGAGIPTRQYSNPAGEVPTFAQYAWAVTQHTRGRHDEAGKIIHHTPRSKRIEYAKRIAEIKRSRGTDRSEVPF